MLKTNVKPKELTECHYTLSSQGGSGNETTICVIPDSLLVKVHSSMTTGGWNMYRGICMQGEKNVTTNSVVYRPFLVSFTCLHAFWECFSMTSLSVIIQHASHVTVTWYNMPGMWVTWYMPVMWQSHDTCQSCDSHMIQHARHVSHMIQHASHVTVTWYNMPGMWQSHDTTCQSCDSHMVQLYTI